MKRILVCVSMFALSIYAAWAIILPNGSDVIISSIEKYDSGSIKSVTLAEDSEFITKSGTFTFKSGSTVTFYENGNIETSDLNDRKVEFYENGFLKTITPVKDTQFKTKYGDLFFSSGEYRNYTVEFYDDGFVKNGYLKEQQRIKTSLGTIECKQNYDNNKTYFHENGSIKSIDIDIFEVDTPLGKLPAQHLDFDENERLTGIQSYTELPKGVYAGFEVHSDFSIKGKLEFYETGAIKSASIHSDDWIKTSAGKIKINPYEDKPVTFYENGTLKSACIRSQVFDTPIGLLSIQEIRLYPAGNIEYIEPSSPTVLPETYKMYAAINKQGYGSSLQTVPECHDIHFYENGTIKHVSLTRNNEMYMSIKNTSYRVGDKIWFYSDKAPMGVAKFSSYNDDHLIFAPDGKLLGRAVIDTDTGLLREATPEENEEKARFYEERGRFYGGSNWLGY